jgi:omega-3 fatty acid desaturase (delta-15 desaturase)
MAHYTLRVLTPFVNWWVYLYVGLPDGGHLFLTGRLWKGATRAELARGYASSVLALIGMGAWYSLLGDTFVRAYCLPWMWYGWWLFTVTFFQHHYEGMLLFREGAWSYVRGAFETIDRTYGFGIDDLHHNITDGHVLHHIFFTKVPHYHLSEATVALKRGLAANGFSKLYQHAPTPGFGLDIFRFLHKHWFWVDDERVVTAIAGKAPPAAKKVE